MYRKWRSRKRMGRVSKTTAGSTAKGKHTPAGEKEFNASCESSSGDAAAWAWLVVHMCVLVGGRGGKKREAETRWDGDTERLGG
jgi:hypothetical protein